MSTGARRVWTIIKGRVKPTYVYEQCAGGYGDGESWQRCLMVVVAHRHMAEIGAEYADGGDLDLCSYHNEQFDRYVRKGYPGVKLHLTVGELAKVIESKS